MGLDKLPDSRLTIRKDLGGRMTALGWSIPVYCAVCGKLHGWVPEEYCDFACWLCNECSDTYGAIFGTMLMPDEQFWAEMRADQAAKAAKGGT